MLYVELSASGDILTITDDYGGKLPPARFIVAPGNELHHRDTGVKFEATITRWTPATSGARPPRFSADAYDPSISLNDETTLYGRGYSLYQNAPGSIAEYVDAARFTPDEQQEFVEGYLDAATDYFIDELRKTLRNVDYHRRSHIMGEIDNLVERLL